MDADELITRLERLKDEIADKCVEVMKDNTPIGPTGRLHESIHLMEKTNDYCVVGTNLHYANVVDKGRGPQTPKRGKYLHWYGYNPGQWSIHQPGDAGEEYHRKVSGKADPNPFRDRTIKAIDKLTFTL